MPLRYTILLLLFVNTASFSQPTADFLILSQPHDYTILNQYQQPITDAEKKLFVANAPLQIVKDNEILGDQLTRALRFAFDGKTWFIEKDETGNFKGDKGKQFRQVLKKCVIIADTVQIIADRAVSFSEKYPPGLESGWLKKGEIVVRLFSCQGFCCVKCPGAKTEYGWGKFGAKTGWKRLEQAAEKQQGLNDMLTERIISRFKDANRTYAEYFSHFDKLTQQEKTVPVWRCEAKGNEVHCSLNAPYASTSQLDESTQYLVRDLENMLIGKQCDVRYEKGEIFIKPKNGEGNGK
jgi:hypothetical protein